MMMASLPTASPIARREIFRRNCRAGGEILRQLGAPCAHALGQARTPRGNARVRHLQARLDRAHQCLERLGGAGLHGKIAWEAAHGIAHIEWILTHMRDAAAAGRMLQVRDPRHIGFDHDHQIGIDEQRAGLETEMHWSDSTAGRPCADCA